MIQDKQLIKLIAQEDNTEHIYACCAYLSTIILFMKYSHLTFL